MESFIEVKNLEKVYQNSTKAVHDFNLEIKKNEFIVIVGPSGCGKSTTLRMIGGLEDITSGELYIDGELANYKPSKDRKVAIVFQSYALYPQMNVYENIAYPLKVNKYSMPRVEENLLEVRDLIKVFNEHSVADILETIANAKSPKTTLNERDYLSNAYDISLKAANRLSKLNLLTLKMEEVSERINVERVSLIQEEETILSSLNEKGLSVNDKSEFIDEKGNVIEEQRKLTANEIEKQVFEAAKILDLGPYLNRLPKQLSGGQMQRVALGRAIVKKVPIFLMDEPLSNLDAKLRLTMRSEIVKLHEKINATTIYVTHDQTEAMTMADRIVVMSKGFVQQIDTPSEIYNNPKNLFVAKFIGSPSIDVLDATIDNGVKVNDITIKMSKENIKKIKNFYEVKAKEFTNLVETYEENTEECRNYVLKVLSSKAEKDEDIVKITKKQNKFVKFFKKFKKQKEEEYIDKDLLSLTSMKEQLEENKDNLNKVCLAIRPENLSLSRNETKGSYPIEVVMSELLGKEYHVHFSFAGHNLIAITDKDMKVGKGDMLYLSFKEENIMVFDPITGDRII